MQTINVTLPFKEVPLSMDHQLGFACKLTE